MTLRETNIFTSRTLREKTLKEKGLNYLYSLIAQNLQDLFHILKWNKEHNIFFYRMSSEIFPFFSKYNYFYSKSAFCRTPVPIGN